MWRSLDDADQAPLRQARRCDVLPGRAIIARDVYQAIVGACPQHTALSGRLREREDGAVVLGTGIVPGNWSAGRIELAEIVSGEVRTDRLPGGAFVGGAKRDIAGGVQDVWVVRR